MCRVFTLAACETVITLDFAMIGKILIYHMVWSGDCRFQSICEAICASMKADIPCPQGGWTPINAAASKGHEAVVRLLLDSKAAVDTANNVSGSEVK